MPKQMFADLVITNGKVVTVDRTFSIAQAVAVKDGKIAAVGTNEDVGALAGKDTQVIDLRGKTMLPGINDSHIHACGFGATRPPAALDVGALAVSSISDIAGMVCEKVQTVQPGEWILGFGWNQGCLKECVENPARRLLKEDLDPVSPNNPVHLLDFAARTIWVNSKTLELAGLAEGHPGVMPREEEAGQAISKAVPPRTREEKRQTILSAMKILNALGITSVTDCLGPGGALFPDGMSASDCISILNDLRNEGKMTLRFSVLLLFGGYGKDPHVVTTLADLQECLPSYGIHTGFGNEWLRIAGVKLFADGAPVPMLRTSWMYQDYKNAPGEHGRLVYVPGKTDEERYDELISQIVEAHKYGFQVGIHATGDRAADACVDGFIKAMKEYPANLRHYIIHGSFVTPQCIRRMAENNIGVSIQPDLHWVSAEIVAIALGEKTSGQQFPARAYIDAGVHVASSSDAPATLPNWKHGVETAILRKSLATGKVWAPEQCMSREEAIRSYTVEGAWIDHMEQVKGSIEVGKVADFCVLDEDILTVDPDHIHDIRTLMTIVGGKIVYDAR